MRNRNLSWYWSLLVACGVQLLLVEAANDPCPEDSRKDGTTAFLLYALTLVGGDYYLEWVMWFWIKVGVLIVPTMLVCLASALCRRKRGAPSTRPDNGPLYSSLDVTADSFSPQAGDDAEAAHQQSPSDEFRQVYDAEASEERWLHAMFFLWVLSVLVVVGFTVYQCVEVFRGEYTDASGCPLTNI